FTATGTTFSLISASGAGWPPQRKDLLNGWFVEQCAAKSFTNRATCTDNRHALHGITVHSLGSSKQKEMQTASL
ncbi:hypothetical protein, partial [Salinivibrio costicola]|uniref:hypothetical protein n=1 Tax=Salinivibrio costicola TaxID=51367 RepID=UPI000565A933